MHSLYKLLCQLLATEIFNSRGKLSSLMCSEVDKSFLEFEVVLKMGKQHARGMPVAKQWIAFLQMRKMKRKASEERGESKWSKSNTNSFNYCFLLLLSHFCYCCPTPDTVPRA